MSSLPPFAAIDEQKFGAFHWRMIATTGMGVFCDGYDLNSIGIVLPLVLASFGVGEIGGGAAAWLATAALMGSVVGALLFGVLGQFGRKRFYGFDLLLMGAMALAQAFASDIHWLIAFRFLLGIGIGADYVLSPTMTVEHANRASRGKMIVLGFAVTWILGAVAAALSNLMLEHLGVNGDLQWRIVLAMGALPALGTLYLRRTMPETARYLSRLAAKSEQAAQVIRGISGQAIAAASLNQDSRRFWTVLVQHLPMILSVALLWMVFDMVVYPSDLFGPSLIAHSLGMTPIGYSLFMHLVFSIPSALLYAWFLIDRIGRKRLQIGGYLGAAFFLLLFGLLQQFQIASKVWSVLAFGMFSVSLGAVNCVSGTGILGVELTPTRIRTFGHAITVVGGRIGATIAGLLFPLVFTRYGETVAIWGLAGLAIAGAWLTSRLVPETAGESLEHLNNEDMPEMRHASPQEAASQSLAAVVPEMLTELE